MPENNEPQYELDHDYAPLGIVDAEDGSGTTWPEFVGQVNKMDNQVAALTEDRDSRTQELQVRIALPNMPAKAAAEVVLANNGSAPTIPEDAEVVSCWFEFDEDSSPYFLIGQPCKSGSGYWFVRAFLTSDKNEELRGTAHLIIKRHTE